LQPPASSDPDDLDRGDKLIRSGRFDLALPVFRGFGPTIAPPLHDLIQYRIGLCLEGMGRWDEAVATYRGLITQGPNVRVTAAAQVAQARIAFQRGRPEEIQDLLCRMLLHSARYTKHCSAALEEAQFLLAFALTRAAAQAQSSGLARTPGQLHMPLGEPTAITFSIARALAWADPPLETERPPIHEPAPPGVAALKLVAPSEESSVRASFAPMPIPQLLDQLAAVCGLKTEWTVRAREQVKAHEVDVEVENVPFLDVVQNVAGPFQLTWKIEQGVVSWAVMEETPPEERAAFLSAVARRALRVAVASHENHELAAAAYLYLGNLEVRAGQLPAAVAKYEQLIQQNQRSPLLTEANYNLGLVQHRLGDALAAQKAFYRVVDLAPGHVLAPMAYLALGRTWLEEGQPARAISPLRRALGAASPPVQPVIAITLAASYLWSGNPQAANAVLLTYRAEVNQPPNHRLAAFLDAFSRFQAASDRRQTRHATDLLAAMLNMGEESYLGSLGVLLVGQAYRELGMMDQMIVVYEPTLRRARGPVAEEMSYSLAEAYRTLGKVEDAKRLLLSLAILDGSRWAAPAKFRLAQIALVENRSKEALLWCRQLLPVQPPEKMPALLQLMGQAFEQAGDIEQAARCFRGERPS